MRKALVLGCNGQDGSYLCELLLSKGYQVFGLVRRTSGNSLWRIQHLLDKVTLFTGDITDESSLVRAVWESQPDEVYNLAAQTQVGVSFQSPLYTLNATGGGVVKLLEVLRSHHANVRLYQASSSEMFGTVTGSATEQTPFNPQSPYAAAKVYAHQMCAIYRQAYQMFICCGINFNHESERRGEDFVTRKTTLAIGRIKTGQQDKLLLGNLDTYRDWNYAPEVMEAAWRILQESTPRDYVVASGESHSVAEFVQLAFHLADLPMEDYLVYDPKLLRPCEVHRLCGDSTLARKTLGWQPKVGFQELVRKMVDHDLNLYRCAYTQPDYPVEV